MARYPDTLLDDLRDRVSLAEVIIGFGAVLHRVGRAWRGPCPFEGSGNAKSDKFMINGDHYTCFACGKKGNIFRFLMEREQMAFPDAVRWVAERAGVDLAPYERPVADTAAERARAAQAEALTILADLCANDALSVADPAWASSGGAPVSLTLARRQGLVGRCPDLVTVTDRFAALGVSVETQTAIGWLPQGATTWPGQWILWSHRRDQAVAGRPLGHRTPLVAMSGWRAHGWVQPARATGVPGSQTIWIAPDDTVFLTLLQAGETQVWRALHPVVTAQPLPVALRDLRDAPVLVSDATLPGRRTAFREALRLLSGNPRLRVWELPTLTPPVTDAVWADQRQRALRRAGTVLDWQMQLWSQAPTAAPGSPRHAKMAQRLAAVLEAVPNPLEHRVYAAEIQSVFGDGEAPAPRPTAGRTTPRGAKRPV